MYPELDAPPGYRIQPVHPWQRDRSCRDATATCSPTASLRILDDEIDAVPTAALRTLLLPPPPTAAATT